MRKRVFTLLTSSFLTFKSFDAFSRDAEVLHNTEHFSKELKRQMAEEAFVDLYNSIDYKGNKKPSYSAFRKGIIGFLNLKKTHKTNIRNILTLIDFNLPSKNKRLWVIDLDKKAMVFHDYVAHGRNSGNQFAKKFSNQQNSNASSLGFYLTGEIYNGKYGRSLRLDGMEEGINDNARDRAVVLHGADYVSADIIKTQGRLGRSLGCPAVPFENKDEIVNTIAEKTVMFINGPDIQYGIKSLLLNAVEAIDYFSDLGFSIKS